MIQVLSQAYDILNEGLFDNQLPAPQVKAVLERRDVLHFDRENGEIQIGTKFIAAHPIEIIDYLLHCMVHILNHQRGIDDVSSNQYHRMEFRVEALAVGLIVVCHNTRGWGVTHSDLEAVPPDVKVLHPKVEDSEKRSKLYKQINLDPAQVAAYQRELQETLDQKPSKQFQFKYVCSCHPPIIVRVGRRPEGSKPLDATCGYCNAKFVLDESRSDA